jgi:hypothetical protein
MSNADEQSFVTILISSHGTDLIDINPYNVLSTPRVIL